MTKMVELVPPESKNLFFGLYVTTAIVGLVGNTCVIRTFWKQLRQDYCFHIQLAVANSISLVSITMAGPSALQGRWLFGDVMCTWFGIQAFMAGFAEMTFICLICIECYLATRCRPLYEKISPKLYMVLSGSVWCYAVFFSLVPAFGWSSYLREQHGTSCTLDMATGSTSSYSYLMTTQTIFLLFACVAFVCLILAKTKDNYTTKSSQLIAEQDLLKIALSLFCVLGVCCAPFYARVIWYLRGYSAFFDSFIGIEFSHLAMKFGSATQPFVYFMISRKFRSECVAVVTGVDMSRKRD